MRLRDYTVGDTNVVSADFLNQVAGDFSNAMAEAYLELEGIKNRNTAYKSAVSQSMSFLAQRANALTTAQSGLKVTAYDSPLASSNVQVDTTYGQVTLLESNRVTHFPTLPDNYGRQLAISAVGVYSGATVNTLVVDQNARVLVDNEGEIWSVSIPSANTDSGSYWLRITTPIISTTPNFVAVYPLAGTTVNQISILRQGGSTDFLPVSVWPVKIHQNFSDFNREIRIKISGVLQDDGSYLFSLRKIDLYSVSYASQGSVSYVTKDAFSSVQSVTLNNPYFYPVTSQSVNMVQIQVLTLNGLTTLYDSFIASSPFSVPSGPAQLIVKATLYRTAGGTPFVRTIV